MIKAESKGGERNLRSASPHRNAYKSDFHAIKCSFDGPKSEGAAKSYANGSSDTREDSRGRPFGTRVNKIKNIFLQMDGQQQECQQPEGKVALKSDVAPVSPPKVQFPVNTHRVNYTSPASPETHNLDKTPKGEDVEIDKVALAEKFSVTRKLFERGIKDQPAAEKQSPSRVVTRLSLGSASDEVKSARRVSSGSETTTRPEQAECRHDAPRVALNAGPMSKRLENYMPENDMEDNNTRERETGSVKQHSTTEHILPTSPTRDSSHKYSTPFKETTKSTPVTDATNKNAACVLNKSASTGTGAALKPTFPATNAAYKSPEQTTPVNHGYKRSSASGDGFNRTSVGGDEGKLPRDGKQPPAASSVGFLNKAKLPEKTKGSDMAEDLPRDKSPPSQTPSPPESKGLGMVRAELVVVQNESSDSEEDEEPVFAEQKVQSPKDLPTTTTKINFSPLEKQNCSPTNFTKESHRFAETVGEGSILEEKRDDGLVANRDGEANCEEDEEVAEEDGELEDRVGQNALETPAVVYGIENAAFVDDRDVDQVLREEDEEEDEEDDEEEEEEEEQMYREYDACYEIQGLSDEEEPHAKRKIRFSTDPILVRFISLFKHLTISQHLKTHLIINHRPADSAAVMEAFLPQTVEAQLLSGP